MESALPSQVLEIAAALRERLREDLAGLYLYGSSVDGGLRPASDLDLMAVLRHRLTADERAWLLRTLLALSSPPGDPARRALELTCVALPDIVPWRHPALRELQFGEWLRDDLLRGGVPSREPDPDLALLIAQARANGVALHGARPGSLLPIMPAEDLRAAMLAMLPELAGNLIGEETHALLTLARMWVTLESGDIVPKDVAASRVAPRLPGAHRAALERARDIYRGQAADDWRRWEDRVAGCVRAMLAGIAPWTADPSRKHPAPQ